MRAEIWSQRAASLAVFSGQGLSVSEIASRAGLSSQTVRKYGKTYDLDFGSAPLADDLIAKLEALSKEGKTRKEAAVALDISYAAVVKSEVHFEHGGKRREKNSREEAMEAMYRGGKTLEEIGSAFGVSRERVRQLLKKYCKVSGCDGGQAVSSALRQVKAKAKRDADSLRRHGCTYDQYRSLVTIGAAQKREGSRTQNTTPTGAFLSQRRNALSRGIDWNITLWDWWLVWEKSGKWESRGRGKDCYVMCRFLDEGAYEVGNVYIATQSHNASFQPNNPYRVSHPDHKKVMSALVRTVVRRARKTKNFDLPVGVTRQKNRYIAQINLFGKNKHLGSFGNPEDAHQAYLRAADEAGVKVAA
jgi:DNA-binding CsgD family transcriptional regulator